MFHHCLKLIVGRGLCCYLTCLYSFVYVFREIKTKNGLKFKKCCEKLIIENCEKKMKATSVPLTYFVPHFHAEMLNYAKGIQSFRFSTT